MFVVTILHKYTFLLCSCSVYVHNVRYIRKLNALSVFCCLDVQLYHLWDKSRFVCAHIGQNRDIYPPSIFRLHFDSYPLPLLRRLTVGAAIEKNFFYFFKTLLQLVKFWLSIPYQLLSFLVLYSFDYDLDLLHIVENYGFDIISRFRIFDSIFRLVFTRWIFLASISTCLSIVDSMLWLFDSLSL